MYGIGGCGCGAPALGAAERSALDYIGPVAAVFTVGLIIWSMTRI